MAPDPQYQRYERIFASTEAPFAFVDLDAFWANGADLLRRAGGKPIRVACKSLRCRGLLEQVLARDDGFRGLLTYTLPETLWLAARGPARPGGRLPDDRPRRAAPSWRA